MNDIYIWKKHFQNKSQPSKLPLYETMSNLDLLNEMRDTFKRFGITNEEKVIKTKKRAKISTNYVTEAQKYYKKLFERVLNLRIGLLNFHRKDDGYERFLKEETDRLLRIVSYLTGDSCCFLIRERFITQLVVVVRHFLLGRRIPYRESEEDRLNQLRQDISAHHSFDNSVDSNKLAAFCEKLDIFVSERNIAMILFDDKIWEVELETGNTYVNSRIVEGRKASVCLRLDSKYKFFGYSDYFTARELLILSKIVAISVNLLPEVVNSSVEKFLMNGKHAEFVVPRAPQENGDSLVFCYPDIGNHIEVVYRNSSEVRLRLSRELREALGGTIHIDYSRPNPLIRSPSLRVQLIKELQYEFYRRGYMLSNDPD